MPMGRMRKVVHPHSQAFGVGLVCESHWLELQTKISNTLDPSTFSATHFTSISWNPLSYLKQSSIRGSIGLILHWYGGLTYGSMKILGLFLSLGSHECRRTVDRWGGINLTTVSLWVSCWWQYRHCHHHHYHHHGCSSRTREQPQRCFELCCVWCERMYGC